MKDYRIFVEERLNTGDALQKRNLSDADCLHYAKAVAEELSRRPFEEETTLYEDICQYINRINQGASTEKFLKKSGKTDEKKFYDYAQIDKNTWSNIRLKARGITKESALKLVIALQLSEKEAQELLKKASWSYNKSDYRDRVIIALLHVRCFDPRKAAWLLEEYGKNERHPFRNIYDMKRIAPLPVQ